MYLTPDSESGIVCRSLLIPLPILPAVNGALGELERAYNWEAFGNMSIDDCVNATKAMIASYHDGGSCMIGVCLPYASTTIPDNMLACDGSVYNRVDYPLLYAALDTSYIVDADTFTTPNYSGRVARGTSGAHNVEGGNDTHTLVANEMPPHDHAISNGYGPDVASSVVLGALSGLEASPTVTTTSGAGGGQAHNNLPAYHGDPWGIIWR